MIAAATPSIIIELSVEARAPRVLVVAETDGQEVRILDWVRSQDDLAELVARALELAGEARAA